MKIKTKNIKDKEILEDINEIVNNQRKKIKTPMEKDLKSSDPIKHFISNYSTSNFKSNSVNQKNIIKSICSDDVSITVVYGKPGTGKTYSAVQGALKEFKTKGTYKKIYLLKSVKSLDDKSEDLGFLKGSMEDKIAPFVFSYDFNFHKIIDESIYKFARENKIIDFLPLAYIRGIGISDAIVILDECQNLNNAALRTVLTRMGTNVKLIIAGDTAQKDSSKKDSSGLEFLIKHFKGNLKGMNFIEMTKDDQSRSPLINDIEDIYENLEKQGINIH